MSEDWKKILPIGFASALAISALPLMAVQAGDHLRHHHDHAAPGYARQSAVYRVPEATLQRADGSEVNIARELDDGKPVVLNFIYTTCTAVCPILSQNFAEFQHRLGSEVGGVHMVSISIDPEQDTAERLSEYARRLHAGRQWDFYTGSVAASTSLQKAFQAYFGDKMHHRPMTFMRAAPGEPWLRLEGFTDAAALVAEYRQLVAAR